MQLYRDSTPEERTLEKYSARALGSVVNSTLKMRDYLLTYEHLPLPYDAVSLLSTVNWVIFAK